MFEENDHKTDKESFEMLKYLFEDAQDLYKVLAPEGWGKSEFVHFLHPTPKQQYEEHKTMTDNKPLTPIVQAYKNVYAVLPKGHPQKEFE